MADGTTYDGKSAYYASVRRAGCEIVGDDFSPWDVGPREIEPVGIEEDISRAIDELESR